MSLEISDNLKDFGKLMDDLNVEKKIILNQSKMEKVDQRIKILKMKRWANNYDILVRNPPQYKPFREFLKDYVSNIENEIEEHFKYEEGKKWTYEIKKN